MSALLLLFTVPSQACNVPVFRYALERWPPGPYELVLFHRGPFTATEQAAIDLLEKAPATQFANLTTIPADLSVTLERPIQKLWQHQQTNATLPWVVVRFPESEPDTPAVWAGPLNADSVQSIIDSPARREITRRLLDGESSVWALLASGNQAQDDSTALLLKTELKKMETTLTLPPPAPDDPQMRSSLPLRMAFSVVRISREEAAEAIFIRMLAGGEKELAAAVEPVAFPIFGRGRMLAALAKKELGPKLIAQACSFMSGACSCEVKEMSPGRDLLLAANWNAIFNSSTPTEPEKPSPAPVIAQGRPKPPALAVAAPGESLKSQPRFPKRILLAGLALAAALVVVTGWIALRSKHPRI